ncbi:carbohydrate-binding module family 6 protein [Oidiodendron maius Zn]|uniref:beta-glucosidase n=1 Tax=Oidiodendron maius (strain Zn) TaxID=913774 RepID=A0A0C3GTY0_OIDMZ|nr:carbohydrate-binding module family 6 protein [Oidiodendron maius Zn]
MYSLQPKFWAAVATLTSLAQNKAEASLKQLSINDKVGLVSGSGGDCVGNTFSAPSIGYPSLCLQDGPLGVRQDSDNTTAFTPGIMAAATWDIQLIQQRGQFIGEEAKAIGINAQLGPVCGPLGKVVYGGRNWEGFSVDPYLQGIATALTVEGIQSSGVQAVTKHFIANEQETDRTTISSNVDDRVLHELYLWPFADAVHSNTAGIMCSYNQVNGTWACENDHTVNGLLKTELGFQGYVVSDWGAQHSTTPSALSGLDMEMPDSSYYGQQLATAVNNGDVPADRLDDMVRRILASWYLLQQDQNYPPEAINGHMNLTSDHSTNVRAVARDGIALLRNDGNTLPLSRPGSLAIIGSAAQTSPLGMGWGSGSAAYPYFVTPYDAINARAGTEGTSVTLGATDDPTQGANAAQGKDIAIVVVTSDSGEGSDRSSLDPDNGGNELVQAVAAANPNTIVVVHSVGPIILETILDAPGVRAVVWAGLPSSESGNALVDILYGDTSPSGKLPYTIAQSESDYPAVVITGPSDDFAEGLYIDYRHFDTNNIEPRYEFGFGLSYTNFSYSDLNINSSATPGPAASNVISGGRADLWEQVASVTCTITNDGAVAGKEVAQLYIGMPSSAPEAPPRQLRGFTKLSLGPGESGVATFSLRRRDLSFWDVELQEWVLPYGPFNLYIGATPISALSTIQAEAYTLNNGTQTQATLDVGGGNNVGWIHQGEWLGYSDIDFGTVTPTQFIVRVASGATDGITGVIQVVLDSLSASPICSLPVSGTGDWQNWTNVSATISAVTGIHTVYLLFTSDQDFDFINVNWFTFSS